MYGSAVGGGWGWVIGEIQEWTVQPGGSSGSRNMSGGQILAARSSGKDVDRERSRVGIEGGLINSVILCSGGDG